MNDWAGLIDVPAATLEQFVFGNDLRRDKTATNPRNELLDIIRTLIV
jgi:hypothetical protein